MNTTTVHYCWLCEAPVQAPGLKGYADRHYETCRVIFFCSLGHWDSYRQLAEL